MLEGLNETDQRRGLNNSDMANLKQLEQSINALSCHIELASAKADVIIKASLDELVGVDR
jgi:hypothetical protein